MAGLDLNELFDIMVQMVDFFLLASVLWDVDCIALPASLFLILLVHAIQALYADAVFAAEPALLEAETILLAAP